MRQTVIHCVLVTTALSGPAGAQSAADKATAQALFDAGRRLLQDDKYAESCSKFVESQRLDPALGTLFNLADCYEKSGLTASAWATWLEAAAMGSQVGQTDRERYARERAAALRPRLVSITIVVPEAQRIAGLEVRRGGAAVGIAALGTAVPVDPGSHSVLVSAPGRRDWQTTVTVVEGMQPILVTVPPLEDVPASVSPTQSSQPTPTLSKPLGPLPSSANGPGASAFAAALPADSTRHTLAYVASGVGVVGVAVGSVFGIRAYAKNKDSLAKCKTSTVCDKAGYEMREEAFDAATYSTVAFGVGTAALITATVAYLWTVRTSESTLRQSQAHWSVDAGGAASSGRIMLQGAF